MPRIETRTVKIAKTAHHRGRKATRNERAQSKAEQEARFFNRFKRLEARKARAQQQITTRSDGVTRCSKCPPRHCCDSCARINKARQQAGLIRPKGSPEPHPNNCMRCIPDKSIKSRPRTPEATGTFEVLSIDVVPLGGGWYLGQAFLGRECVYERKFRSRDKARQYAVNSMVDIREGLRFEQLLQRA